MVDLRKIKDKAARSVPKDKSLAVVAPEVAAEWHPTLNGSISPTDVSYGSPDKAYWLCPNGHSYPARISDRACKKSGCPYCSGKMVLKGFNDLETCFPEIAKEWHPSLNGDLQPSEITKGSNKKVWWLCPNGHSYPARIRVRVGKKSGCPYCSGNKVLEGFNDLSTVAPEIAREWHPNLNGSISPSDVSYGSKDKAFWLCPNGHSYSASINNRVGKKRGCPYCSGNKVLEGFNDLSTVAPEIAREWHPTLNGSISPSDVHYGSGKKAFWLCPNGHSYPAQIYSRVRNKTGCPYCSGKMVLKGFNDLETCFPEIAKEWHPSLNGDLQPSEITKGSNKKVWWLCPRGHEYPAKVLHRTISGSGCPYCSGKSVLPEDSIAHKYPDLMAEWDAVSNYAICDPNEIGESSNYDVWWNCLNDPNHKYPMPVYQRVSFYNRSKIACPYCKGRRRKKSHFI